jgi:signal transduction histidine kinase
MIAQLEPDETARDRLVHEYARALRDYLEGAGEDALARAYELGRSAVAGGVGVVEAALLHHSVVSHVAPAPSSEQQERSAQFLAEALSPFELTHRGFREANERMEQMIRELRTNNQQLEQTSRELLAANEAAQAANRELEAFSHTVAHDLRSPLNAVIGFADLILDGVDAAATQRFAHEIAQAGRRMNSLIGALLEFSRSGRGELNETDLDVSALAERILALLRVQPQYARAEVTISPGLRAWADPALMDVVLTNLLSNGLKYSSKRAAPKVELGKLDERAGTVIFFVRDNGTGFDMAHAERLFAAFQRLHPAHEFEGNGIGLATVQRIIRRHRGEVWAEGAPDQGATFYFTLAAAPERA